MARPARDRAIARSSGMSVGRRLTQRSHPGRWRGLPPSHRARPHASSALRTETSNRVRTTQMAAAYSTSQVAVQHPVSATTPSPSRPSTLEPPGPSMPCLNYHCSLPLPLMPPPTAHFGHQPPVSIGPSGSSPRSSVERARERLNGHGATSWSRLQVVRHSRPTLRPRGQAGASARRRVLETCGTASRCCLWGHETAARAPR
jgi:hypothetical protein